jgi:hypothetical protein
MIDNQHIVPTGQKTKFKLFFLPTESPYGTQKDKRNTLLILNVG